MIRITARDILSIVAKKDLDNFEVEGFDVDGQPVFQKSAADMKENESLKINVHFAKRNLLFTNYF